jgi:guanine deaminase
MKRAFRGEIVHFTDDPRASHAALRHFRDGVLVVEGGRVAAAGPADPLLAGLPAGTPVEDRRGSLLVPGFVDAHIHYSQTDVIASHSRHLLEWLEQHTFAEESRFGDAAHAAGTAQFFLDELLRNGTTTAAVYPTVHKASVDAFFAAASRRGLRMICGKVLMDRHCPEPLRDSPQAAYDDSVELIGRWHGKGRLAYAVTPRFAPTSSEAQLDVAARLLDEFPGVRMQTHVAENHDEVRWMRQLFPSSRSYLEVYERHRLLRPGALLAHCIHFDAADWALMRSSGAAAVHCPTSNLFLGSGLVDFGAARAAGAAMALATDVGGGTSFSMLRTMHEAYKVAQMGRHPFTPHDAFYLATLGGARALGFGDQIGSFEAGKEADFLVLDPSATPLLARRTSRTDSLEERLFALMMLGDDRAVAETWVLGERVSRRETAATQ